MKTFINPDKSTWTELLKRPVYNPKDLKDVISNVFQNVERSGDASLFNLTQRFDKVDLKSLRVSQEDISKSDTNISMDLKNAIDLAFDNIYCFHNSQIQEEPVIDTMAGVKCWRKFLPIEKVGLYIPGGSAPLFSTLLMLGIPATIAKCSEIVVVTPPNNTGQVDVAILYVAKKLGITNLFSVGGAQAIAALALGTETIPKVDKIFGPGNQYVTSAKDYAKNYGVDYDMPAGPSEVLIIADEQADPKFIAADLLSQAEHGSDSQVVLLSESQELLAKVEHQVIEFLKELPRAGIAKEALKKSLLIQLSSMEEILEMTNEYAPEHLIINMEDAEVLAGKIKNAGSVFIGSYTPESVGDYASGTNHTLPTNGWAKTFSGVSLSTFQKSITYQKLTKVGLENIGESVEIMAKAEGLEAHALAVRERRIAIKEAL